MIDRMALDAERERYVDMQRTTAARGIIRQAMAVRGETPDLLGRATSWLLDMAPDDAPAALPQPVGGLLE